MILRVYGDTVQSVEIRFDSKAFNEVGFRRDRQESFPLADFESEWEKVEEHEIADRGEGLVQEETHQGMLDRMRAHLDQIIEGLGKGEVVRVENTERDWPKTRDKQRVIVKEGENRLHFDAWVEPALRVAVWRKKAD